MVVLLNIHANCSLFAPKLAHSSRLLPFGAWPAGAHPDRNDSGAGQAVFCADWPDGRRLAPDGGSVPYPLLAAWREGSATLAPYRDLLGSSRVRASPFSHSLGLGVRGSAVLVGVLSHGGTLVPRRLRDRGVSQPGVAPLARSGRTWKLIHCTVVHT